MHLAGQRSRRASISVVAATLVLVAITSPAASQALGAVELIQCPDWQRYVTPAAAIRTTPPKQSFEAALAETRARESRAAANAQAGQAVPTGTPASAAAESGAPLPLPAGFTRTARRESAATNPTRTPRSARQTRQAANQAAARQAAATCQYTVLAGDTLSKIATRRLGNTRRWPELARANALTATSILRIGQPLHLPCAPDRQRPERGQPGTPPTPAAAPAPRPLPVWTARPDEFVSDVITRWARRAGHTVVRDGVEEWKISVPVTIRGSFKDALDQLVVGFEGSGRPLAISIYANKVIRIGRPL